MRQQESRLGQKWTNVAASKYKCININKNELSTKTDIFNTTVSSTNSTHHLRSAEVDRDIK